MRIDDRVDGMIKRADGLLARVPQLARAMYPNEYQEIKNLYADLVQLKIDIQERDSEQIEQS